MPDAEFRELNEEFYQARPGRYFSERLQLLALRAAKSAELAEVMGSDVTWGPLRLNAEASTSEGTADDHDPQSFVVTESHILLHHAAETLLRLFLAHEENQACPWLETSGLLNFNRFRKKVDALAKSTWTEERVAAVAWVFLGGQPTNPSAEWEEHRDAAVRLLRTLARTVRDGKNLYNSAKHGLTALGSHGALHVLPEFPDGLPDLSTAAVEESAVLGVDGVNVSYLEREGDPEAGYSWFHKTEWVSPERAAWLTHLAIIQMDALWTVARWHYLGERPPAQLSLVSTQALDALKGFSYGGDIRSWRVRIATQPGSEQPKS